MVSIDNSDTWPKRYSLAQIEFCPVDRPRIPNGPSGVWEDGGNRLYPIELSASVHESHIDSLANEKKSIVAKRL